MSATSAVPIHPSNREQLAAWDGEEGAYWAERAEQAAAAAQAGALSAPEADSWLRQLVDAGRRGRFFWAPTMFAVASIRP